jgi:hypothetical protein
MVAAPRCCSILVPDRSGSEPRVKPFANRFEALLRDLQTFRDRIHSGMRAFTKRLTAGGVLCADASGFA